MFDEQDVEFDLVELLIPLPRKAADGLE